MLVVHSWLQEFLSKDLSPQQIAEAMEAAGIEVETVEKTASLDSRIIAAKITSLKPIKGSDHLQLAKVDIGSQSAEVVCGAPNVRVGQMAVLAQVGARLPDDSLIESRPIRGQKSEGMLCSPRELGLGDDHSGLLELEAGHKPGTPLAKVFGGPETVIDVSVAANRPDLRSLIGIAREVAAHTGIGLRLPKTARLPKPVRGLFENKSKSLVSRYSLAKLKLGSKRSESPGWLQRRLQMSGVRPINLIVDITNYTMLETGQPLHGFDANKIKGKIVVRRAQGGEQVQTLDGQRRKLTTEDIVIADSKAAVAIAGVMGGKDTEVDTATSEILLESATFDGASIRRSAIRQNLVSEASLRFQHQLPSSFVEFGIGRAVQLLQDLAGGRLERFDDQGPDGSKPAQVTVDVGHMNRVLGVNLQPKQASELLKRLGFGVGSAAKTLKVSVPNWRTDVSLAEDIYEEIIKMVGLEKVPTSLPAWQPSEMQADNYWPRVWELREMLRGLGLNEVTTYPFISLAQISAFSLDPKQHLKLKNPMTEDQTHLRTTLAPNLVQAVANNTRQNSKFSLFEIAQVFTPAANQELPTEIERLAVVSQRAKEGYGAVKHVLDQLAVQLHTRLHLVGSNKLPFLHPARQAEVMIDDQPVAFIGELNPLLTSELRIKGSVGYLEMWLDGLFAGSRLATYRPISRYPAVTRDITITLDSKITWQDVGQMIEVSGLAEPEYVGDFYEQKGTRALTLRLRIEPTDKTLTENEISERVQKVTKLLEQNFAAQLKD